MFKYLFCISYIGLCIIYSQKHFHKMYIHHKGRQTEHEQHTFVLQQESLSLNRCGVCSACRRNCGCQKLLEYKRQRTRHQVNGRGGNWPALWLHPGTGLTWKCTCWPHPLKHNCVMVAKEIKNLFSYLSKIQEISWENESNTSVCFMVGFCVFRVAEPLSSGPLGIPPMLSW